MVDPPDMETKHFKDQKIKADMPKLQFEQERKKKTVHWTKRVSLLIKAILQPATFLSLFTNITLVTPHAMIV